MKKIKSLRKSTALLLLICMSALVPLSGCSSSGSPVSSTAAAVPTTSTASAEPTASTASVTASGDKKVLRIALECAYAPYNWTQTDDSNGAVPIFDSNTFCNGYDIQIAKKIAEGMGYGLEVHKTEWTAIPTAITSGKVDAGICGMTVTAERKETLLFSEPYYNSQYVVLVKKGGKYENAKSLADLQGANCTSQQSTSWYTLLSQIPSGKVQPAVADVPTMLVALNSGKCEVLSCDKPTALGAVKAYPDLKLIEFSGDSGFKADSEATHVCAALAKGNTELKEKIDSVLKGISDDDRTKLMDSAIKSEPSA
jgi:putative lysine transport system substrate-binding protein